MSQTTTFSKSWSIPISPVCFLSSEKITTSSDIDAARFPCSFSQRTSSHQYYFRQRMQSSGFGGSLTQNVASSVKRGGGELPLGNRKMCVWFFPLSSPSLLFFPLLLKLPGGAKAVSSVPRRDFQISSHRFTLGCHSCPCGDEPVFTKASFSFSPSLSPSLPLSVVQWLSNWPGLTGKRLDLNEHVPHSKEARVVLFVL